MSVDILQNLVWPLGFVLVLLFVVRKAGDQFRPVVTSVVNGLAAGAQRHAMNYAKAFLFGLSASLYAFSDVFSAMSNDAWNEMNWHQYLGAWAKVMNPFVVAVLAYITQTEPKAAAGSGGTNPPIPSR